MHSRLLVLFLVGFAPCSWIGLIGLADAQPPRDARRDQIVARVGAVSISAGEVEDAINREAAVVRERHYSPEGRRLYIEEWIERELMAQEAARRGFDTHPEVTRTVAQSSVQELVRREFDERITPQSIPEADVRAYYDDHEAEFSRPEMVRASHVLLDNAAAAQALIPQVRSADPRALRHLVAEHSIDTETNMRAGDLRYFTRTGRPPNSQDAPVEAALVEAAFQLTQIGEVSPRPVAVGRNYSVVRLTGRQPAQQRQFAEVAHSIRLRLWRERRTRALAAFVQQLEQRFSPQVHPERIGEITLDIAPPRPGLPSPHRHPGPEDHTSE